MSHKQTQMLLAILTASNLQWRN